MKLLSELHPIAEQFGIRNISKYTKEKLVYEIIKQQSERPGPEGAEDTSAAPDAAATPAHVANAAKPALATSRRRSDYRKSANRGYSRKGRQYTACPASVAAGSPL